MRALDDEPLAPRTTLGIGGRARRLIELADEAELAATLREDRERGAPLYYLGGGSNVVIADAGLDATVLQLRDDRVAFERERDRVLVSCAAGVEWDALVARSVDEGLAGLECLSGIPGHVGASPIQNVGAYGQQVEDTLVSVRVVDRDSGEAQTLSADDCELSYRGSVFKSRWPGRYIVVEVTFALRPGPPARPRYGELSRALDQLALEQGRAPSLAEVRQTVLRLRRGKGMVVDPSERDSRSAGSFFVNPTLPEANLEPLRQRARQAGLLSGDDDLPHFAAHTGARKVAAAWLIERAGFAKGHVHRDGGVGLSTRHALAIVNRGGGTAAAVAELAEGIQRAVWERFAIELTPEPQFLGLAPPRLERAELLV